MADSTSPAGSLSARFGEWFKSQPEAQIHALQALDQNHLRQPSETAAVHGVKGPNGRVTPILYDFESKYAIEDTDSFADGEVSKRSSVSNSSTAGHLHNTKNVHVNDTNVKARKVLGLDHQPGTAPPQVIVSHSECTSPFPSFSARKTSNQPAILPPTPAIFLLPNKKPWTKTHIRTLIILSIILQAGVIAVTTSIVLCTQATKSGRTTDGSIITGVVGCASIICGLITGYDMLIAEYAPSQHQQHLPHPSAPDIEKGILDSGPATKSSSRKFSNKELSIDIHAANAGRYHITHHQLPHNVMYNSRLSSSFPHANPLASPYATSLTSPYATSLTSPSAPPLTSPRTTSLSSPRTLTARRLTPHSPLPYSPTLGSLVPSPTSSLTPKTIASAESWAQKLESRVRPLSKISALQRLSTLKEEEGEARAAEGTKKLAGGKDELKGKQGRDSTTSHILSLYGEGLRSWPVTPAAGSTFELSASATPRRSSFLRLPKRESEGGRRGSVEGMWGQYTPQQ